MAIIVDEGQCLNDITIQYVGDIEAVFAVGMLNDLSVTDIPLAGSQMEVVDVVNKQTAKYFSDTGKVPSTAGFDGVAGLEGIGYWTIGKNFKVS